MRNIKHIISTCNPEIKEITKLHDSKFRKNSNKCLFQNIRAIETALQANLKLDKIYITEPNLQLILNLFKSYNINNSLITLVSESIINKISTLKNSSGIVATFYIKENNIKTLKSCTSGLVLAQINDPGNMGTLIRTSVACNIKNIFIIEGADPYSSKVIQASAGTIALADIYQISWQELIDYKEDLKLYALVAKNGESIFNENFCKPADNNNILLVVGNEANGIKAEWLNDCNKLITLKMPGNTESLNAAIAGSIALYIAFCQNNNI